MEDLDESLTAISALFQPGYESLPRSNDGFGIKGGMSLEGSKIFGNGFSTRGRL